MFHGLSSNKSSSTVVVTAILDSESVWAASSFAFKDSWSFFAAGGVAAVVSWTADAGSAVDGANYSGLD